jgi:GxxExxY protein
LDDRLGWRWWYVGAMENDDSGELLHGEITSLILAAMYDVHNELGFGFLELIYKNALAVALRELGLRVDRNVAYEVHYHGFLLGRYSADLVVESKVNVEAKTARSIDTAHLKQTLNYLRASKLEVGLAINFGLTPQFKRVVYSNEQREKDETRRRLWQERVRRSRAKRGLPDFDAELERERQEPIVDQRQE